MFKKILLTFCILNLFSLGFAQIKAPLELVGKSKGKIQVLLIQNEPFVAARTLGRALGMHSTYFAASGRLELSENSKTALLVSKQPYVFINKQKRNLSQAPFVQDNILYAPLSFFNDFSSYDIVYQNEKLIAERRYSLFLDKQLNEKDFSQIIFKTKGELPFKIVKSTVVL